MERFEPPIWSHVKPAYCEPPPTNHPSSSLHNEGWELGYYLLRKNHEISIEIVCYGNIKTILQILTSSLGKRDGSSLGSMEGCVTWVRMLSSAIG
jgi:hypothetical protein